MVATKQSECVRHPRRDKAAQREQSYHCQYGHEGITPLTSQAIADSTSLDHGIKQGTSIT